MNILTQISRKTQKGTWLRSCWPKAIIRHKKVLVKHFLLNGVGYSKKIINFAAERQNHIQYDPNNTEH